MATKNTDNVDDDLRWNRIHRACCLRLQGCSLSCQDRVVIPEYQYWKRKIESVIVEG